MGQAIRHSAEKQRAVSYTRDIRFQTRELSSAERQRFDAITVIDEADKALYQAKSEGGNRICRAAAIQRSLCSR